MSKNTVVLLFDKTEANELRIRLESPNGEVQREAKKHVADLLWEAVHCPPELTWLQPTPHEM
jgi:uncharacterized protein with von Willebrand factor type A (vWA) domain